jgi:hypothetical protein
MPLSTSSPSGSMSVSVSTAIALVASYDSLTIVAPYAFASSFLQ